MSKKETKNTEQKQEKVMTKYDRKVQRRQEEKAKAKKQQLKSTILGIVLIVGLAAVVLSFPIRNYLTVNGSYIEVDGEKISRVEYDYNYQIAKTNYLSTYGTYLYYMGMDISVDFDDELYSAVRTWGDYFDELAVENLKQTKALLKEAQAAGFTYDVTEDYKEYEEALEATAKEQGLTVKAMIQELYGTYATASRVKPFVQDAMVASAYYDTVYDEKLPTEDEIMARYQESPADYDSVDYYIAYVDAVLPTEPTDESAETTTDTAPIEDAEVDVDAATEAYEPTEEEIAAAMAEAKAAVEEKAKTIRTDGEYMTNIRQEDAVYILQDWLFSDERKKGDSTVIEDSLNSRYYAVEFVKRYLSESLSADIRVVMTADGNADAIYDEWKTGVATEESFAEICDKYNEITLGAPEGGLYEGLKSATLATELQDWIFSTERVAGDTAVITPEGDSYAYVVYYVAPNKAEYILEIQNEIASERMAEYMEGIVEAVVVEDPKDNLKYPELIEEEEALAAEQEAAATSSGAATESSTAQ